MSTIETAAALPAGASTRGPGLPRQARRFYACVVGAALAVAGVALATPMHLTDERWGEFAFLLAGAAVAHYFVVHTSKNQVFHVGLAFAVAGALVLPPRLVVLMCVVQHLSDWAKERYAWYIQVFNIGNYVLAALAAHEVTRLAGTGVTTREWSALVGGVGACVAFVAVNHVLLARMLWLARGRSLDESGLFAFESLLSDLVLALFGLTLVILWHVDPWALPIVFPPLFLIQRALTVPQLWAEARTDAKTELFNARHFGLELAAELRRAARFRRPVSVLMADLDLLREVNNSHGHLAGDAVLRGVADVLRRELRDYDTAARFGGEEFTVLLPETDGERAHAIAERIRAGVEASEISLAPRTGTVRATISVGVATFPYDGSSPEDLLDAADTALYRAKLAGRNSVSA
jgi:diguanylate cyclase (GGDEF)-like protein